MVVTIEDLRRSINPYLDTKRKSRLEVAFRSLGYQDEYCRYHYEEFHKQHQLFLDAMGGELGNEEITNPQYFRLAFEANCFAFFRSFHALIESVPYLLNLLIEVKNDSESRSINWHLITNASLPAEYSDGIDKIKALRASNSYKELEHISNVSKHRRIVRIDSGVFSIGKNPSFCADDFDSQFKSYEINELMETMYDEMHPQVISIIKSFLR
ncbi:hypothetical protein [Vibrio quintilis]|uniref:Cthe-2314-like HEPN domain-containing protein n=1 Tax=Vibrio quintilis TaxID=1117707 RepID=A0A1M7Z032_9VIBR|nr:hypothetical protein [Vibrio quintilis]SHO58066.1 hypothetical protein VQ7734_03836 [Vibrio quintilis]